MRLFIGNKNYSSWSMRPWIAMKVADIPFEEELVPLNTPEFRTRIGQVSQAGKVPILVDGDLAIWDSLAILEYVAEKFPASQLWPHNSAARARARSIASEMHSGFSPLRRSLPMNMARPPKQMRLSEEVLANVQRIENIWADCRMRFGGRGDFLFGSFGAADAMYAPVVSRFVTYAVPVSPASLTYMDAVQSLTAWQEWNAAARLETWVLPHDEIDWPHVPRL